MGFASLVGALDVSRTTQLISLLGRNVGIELGQALVILLVFPGLYVMRRTRVYMPFFIASSLALTFVAAVWSIERALAKDSGMSARIDSVITFPRSLWLVAAFTVLASGARWLERRRLLGQVSTRSGHSGSRQGSCDQHAGKMLAVVGFGVQVTGRVGTLCGYRSGVCC